MTERILELTVEVAPEGLAQRLAHLRSVGHVQRRLPDPQLHRHDPPVRRRDPFVLLCAERLPVEPGGTIGAADDDVRIDDHGPRAARRAAGVCPV